MSLVSVYCTTAVIKCTDLDLIDCFMYCTTGFIKCTDLDT